MIFYVMLLLTEMKSAKFEPHTPSLILYAIKSFYYFLVVWCILMKPSLSENLAIHYSGDVIKKSDMGGACSTYGVELRTGFLWENLRERDHLVYHGVNSRIILKRIFKECSRSGLGHRLDLSDLTDTKGSWELNEELLGRTL
jgi:hypothetical protein